MNGVTVAMYLCSIRAANKSGDFTMWVGYVMLLVEIVSWSVASGLYKAMDRGGDLWGFSCKVARGNGGFVEQVKEFVDFKGLCRKQVSYTLRRFPRYILPSTVNETDCFART